MNGLPVVSLRMIPGTCCCSASAMFSEPVRAICAAPTALIAAGTLSTSIPERPSASARSDRQRPCARFAARPAAHLCCALVWRPLSPAQRPRWQAGPRYRRTPPWHEHITAPETRHSDSVPDKQESSAHSVSSPFHTGRVGPRRLVADDLRMSIELRTIQNVPDRREKFPSSIARVARNHGLHSYATDLRKQS